VLVGVVGVVVVAVVLLLLLLPLLLRAGQAHRVPRVPQLLPRRVPLLHRRAAAGRDRVERRRLARQVSAERSLLRLHALQQHAQRRALGAAAGRRGGD
jgi:hypothetical protein